MLSPQGASAAGLMTCAEVIEVEDNKIKTKAIIYNYNASVE